MNNHNRKTNYSTRIRHHEGAFESSSALSLYYQAWLPKAPLRAVTCIVHGLGGHSGMFSNVVGHLTPQGYGIYGLDLRGHGRSPGQRGYINNWRDFRSDVQSFLHLIAERHPGLPIFIWGHSLGGLVVLDVVLRCPSEAASLSGIIITAPALGPVGVSPIRMAIGRLLSRLWPRFSLDNGLTTIPGSRDPVVVQQLLNDPLSHHRGTARLATEFSKTARWVRSHASDVNLPILILHGGADRITCPQGSRTFFEQIQFPDKERKEYKGGYHEIHADINYCDVLADAGHWLDSHLPAIPMASEPLSGLELRSTDASIRHKDPEISTIASA